MKYILHLIKNDLRVVLRDPTLRVFILLPFMMIAVARFAFPPLGEAFPEIIPYLPVILVLASVQLIVAFSFITSFLILDEKDEQILPALRILPVSPGLFIATRTLMGAVLTLIFSFALLEIAGYSPFNTLEHLGLATLISILTPAMALATASLASNKVEGAALFKGLLLLIYIPVILMFIPAAWTWFFAIFPSFWAFRFAQDALIGSESIALIWLAGLIVCLIALALAVRLFSRKVLEK